METENRGRAGGLLWGWFLCARLETYTHARGDVVSNWPVGSGAQGCLALHHLYLPLITPKPCLCFLLRTNLYNPPHQRLISTFTMLEPHSLRGRGPPGVYATKEYDYQCRLKRCRLEPWVGKIPWRWALQPTSVFLPGESQWTEELGGLQSIGSQRAGHY